MIHYIFTFHTFSVEMCSSGKITIFRYIHLVLLSPYYNELWQTNYSSLPLSTLFWDQLQIHVICLVWSLGNRGIRTRSWGGGGGGLPRETTACRVGTIITGPLCRRYHGDSWPRHVTHTSPGVTSLLGLLPRPTAAVVSVMPTRPTKKNKLGGPVTKPDSGFVTEGRG